MRPRYGRFFGRVDTLNITIKTTLALLVAGTMMQGCGVVALGAIKQNAANLTDWGSRVEHMNCSQMRSELVNLNKRSGFVSNMVPGNNTATKIATLKTHMRRSGCRIPA